MASKYDLSTPATDQSIHGRLAARWLGQAEFPETSTRDLVRWFNLSLVREALVQNGVPVQEHEITNVYDTLTDDKYEDQRWSVRSSLEYDGIDPDELVDDFISTSSMYRHLTDCLEAEKDRKKAETDWENTNIEFAKEKAAKHIKKALNSLGNKGEIQRAGEADVEVEVFLSCPDCSTSVPYSIARQRGYICEEHINNGDSGINTQDGHSDL